MCHGSGGGPWLPEAKWRDDPATVVPHAVIVIVAGDRIVSLADRRRHGLRQSRDNLELNLRLVTVMRDALVTIVAESQSRAVLRSWMVPSCRSLYINACPLADK